MPKQKVSKPVIYLGILGLVVAVLLVLNPPAPPPTTAKSVQVSTSQMAGNSDADGITEEDLEAHFPHYIGGSRDPFVPGVAVLSPQDQAGAAFAKNGEHGGWALTGINSINGVASAVLENSNNGDSVFLEQGDHWNGLRVAAVESEDVVFENALGQKTTLTFSVPDDKQNGPTDAAPAVPNAGSPSAIPSLSEITPLPALPPMQFRRRGRDRTAVDESVSPAPADDNESSNE